MKLSYVKRVLKDYVVNESCPTFSGLLCKLNMTWNDWKNLNSEMDDESVKCCRLLTMYKEKLEMEMEKLLIYQNSKNKFYNYQTLYQILKKSNPQKWGDKVAMLDTKTGIAKLGMGDFTNNSGFDILGDSKDNEKS